MRPREARQVRDKYETGKGCVRDEYVVLEKFTGGGGWWVAEIKYSVCPRPFMRPREA